MSGAGDRRQDPVLLTQPVQHGTELLVELRGAGHLVDGPAERRPEVQRVHLTGRQHLPGGCDGLLHESDGLLQYGQGISAARERRKGKLLTSGRERSDTGEGVRRLACPGNKPPPVVTISDDGSKPIAIVTRPLRFASTIGKEKK